MWVMTERRLGICGRSCQAKVPDATADPDAPGRRCCPPTRRRPAALHMASAAAWVTAEGCGASMRVAGLHCTRRVRGHTCLARLGPLIDHDLR